MQDDEMRKAAREWLERQPGADRLHPATKAMGTRGYRAGWQACASRPLTEAEVEAVAREIARMNGDDYDALPADKSEWNAKQGMFGGRFRDVNEPRKPDYLDMAQAASAALSRLRGASDD